MPAILAEMDSDDLTREQLEQLKEHTGRAYGYFNGLQERTRQRGFPYDDEIRQAVAV
jgi:hypothetical protein